MSGAPEALGIIAGNRTLPLLLAREARRLGVKRLIAVAFENETDPALADLVDEIVWLRVGQLSRLIEAFRDRSITQCVMAGQIAPKNLFDLRPDFLAVKMLFRLKEKNAHTLFGAIAEELSKGGVELVPAVPWLGEHIIRSGFMLGPKLSASQGADVAYGYGIAKEVSRLDIGQTVVVKDGTVLAVEGFEGTDACLSRGGKLAGAKGDAVAVKVAKQGHDLRFDIPCIGLGTIETCATAGVAVLAIESGKTLLLEKEAVEELARKKRICVTAWDSPI